MGRAGRLRRAGAVGAACIVAFATVALTAPVAQGDAPPPLVVTTAEASGGGSLLDAIEQANATVAADVITFDIPGDAPHIIQLDSPIAGTTALPPLTKAVTIDAGTQPGYAGTPLVQIREGDTPSARTAFTIDAADVTISGLSLVGFGAGIRFTAASSNSLAIDNYIGVNFAGDAAQGQQFNQGVWVEGGNNNEVANNLIANAATGIWVYGNADQFQPRLIDGNLIGISADSQAPLPVNEGILLDASGNSIAVTNNVVVGHAANMFGIRLQQTGSLVSVTNNSVGAVPNFPSHPGRVGGGIVLSGATSSPSVSNNYITGGSGDGLVVNAFANVMAGGGSSNVISGNAGDGIAVSGGSLARFQFGGNAVSDNGGLGIDVAPNGVNAEIPLNEDVGPTIESVTAGPADTNSITLSYDGPAPANANKTMGVYLSNNSACDSSDFGEGSEPFAIGGINRLTDANGDFTSTFSIPADILPGDKITAMLTSGDVPSTEYSNCFSVAAPPNTPPVATPLQVSTQVNEPVEITLEGFDEDGIPEVGPGLNFDIDLEPSNGSLSDITGVACLTENECTASVTYTPDAAFTGDDSFTFTVDDGTDVDGDSDVSAPATADITVEAPPNTPPVAQPLSVMTDQDQPLAIVLEGFDADDDVLSFDIAADPSNGLLSDITGVGCSTANDCTASVTYTPTAGFAGGDSFTYTVSDAGDDPSAPATVDIEVQPAEPMADLSMLDLSDDPDPVTSTGVVAYSAQVINSGPDAATNPIIEFADTGTDLLPNGVSFVGGSVTSTLGGSGACSQAVVGGQVICTLGGGSIPVDAGNVWTATVYLQTSASTPASISIEAIATADEGDVSADNSQIETTTVEPFGDDSTTEFVPPSAETATVATAQTVVINGSEVPVAQPGDTTAAAIAVPPGGPGGTVTVAEFDCEPPFCAAAAARTIVPTPATAPFDNRVVQFIPPSASYYDYLHPVRYTISYDASVVGSVAVRNVTALYTKDSEPETLYQANKCPKRLNAATEFPCLQSAKVLKGKNQLTKGDLVLVLLGTYNDPKIAGFR